MLSSRAEGEGPAYDEYRDFEARLRAKRVAGMGDMDFDDTELDDMELDDMDLDVGKPGSD